MDIYSPEDIQNCSWHSSIIIAKKLPKGPLVVSKLWHIHTVTHCTAMRIQQHATVGLNIKISFDACLFRLKNICMNI